MRLTLLMAAWGRSFVFLAVFSVACGEACSKEASSPGAGADAAQAESAPPPPAAPAPAEAAPDSLESKDEGGPETLSHALSDFD